MTIDNAISAIEMGQIQLEISQQPRSIALDTAISIMRKYQKIKEQVDIAIDKENFAISGARLIQIREIIDGNDD